MGDETAKIADLEARVVALQTLVGDLLRIVHQSAPQELDRRLDEARQRRGAQHDAISKEAIHLEIAMLEAAVRRG